MFSWWIHNSSAAPIDYWPGTDGLVLPEPYLVLTLTGLGCWRAAQVPIGANRVHRRLFIRGLGNGRAVLLELPKELLWFDAKRLRMRCRERHPAPTGRGIIRGTSRRTILH